MSDEVRTRFAPSPTGYLHLGGLRTALYTYLFAKKHGGKFILRIEDTDQEREVPGAVDLIYKSMRQAGLTYDEGPDVGGEYGPYIQTQRRDLYPKFAWELVEKGGAYCCFCTKEEIEADRKAAEAKGETYKYNKKCLHNVSLEEAKRRIAAGSGTDVPRVNRVLKQYKQMKEMMKMLGGKGKGGKRRRRMPFNPAMLKNLPPM